MGDRLLDFGGEVWYNKGGMEKVYKDRDWLWEHYIVREESMCAMAKEAGCNRETIRHWLHKSGIPAHGCNALYCNRDWLYEHYIMRKESTVAIAKEVKRSNVTISYWLHKLNIPVRDRGEANFLAQKNSVIIVPGLLKFMGGEIVGDGHVGMNGNRSAFYSHGSKYEEYVVWLSGCFNEWGIEQVGRITEHRDKKTGAIYYHYTSRSYPELVPIRQRWYPNGKKTVPKDLKLTSIMARQWYLGDGGFSDYKRKRPGIILCTDDFDKQSIDHLIKELQKQGFKTTYRPSSNRIYISVHSVKDFLEWIGPCPISCYQYKWAI